MLTINYLVCLKRGHAFSTITYKDSPYQYCLQCGKVAPHIYNRKEPVQRVEVNTLCKPG
jgi:hypothetical protein